MSGYFQAIATAARFSADRGTKADLCRGDRLFVGLNCFEPGQAQSVHRHADADKFYFVVSGKASMRVGEETRDVATGDLIWAPADVPHGVLEALERTTMLVGMAPPPGAP